MTPPDDGGDVTPQYRADIGAYLGNQWMARNLQMQTLYDREGSQYRNADGSVWARFKAGKAESEAVSGNIDMDSNYSQFQLGGDILARVTASRALPLASWPATSTPIPTAPVTAARTVASSQAAAT